MGQHSHTDSADQIHAQAMAHYGGGVGGPKGPSKAPASSFPIRGTAPGLANSLHVGQESQSPDDGRVGGSIIAPVGTTERVTTSASGLNGVTSYSDESGTKRTPMSAYKNGGHDILSNNLSNHDAMAASGHSGSTAQDMAFNKGAGNVEANMAAKAGKSTGNMAPQEKPKR